MQILFNRKKFICCLTLIVALAAIGLASESIAEKLQREPNSQSRKAANKITTLLKTYNIHLHSDSRDQSYCGTLLDSLRKGAFEEIKPQIRAATLDAPEAKKWAVCKPFLMGGPYSGHPDTFWSKSKFQGYKAELDGNEQNGKEYILSTEGISCRPENKHQCWGQFEEKYYSQSKTIFYQVVNPTNCTNTNQSPLVADRADPEKYILVDNVQYLKYSKAEAPQILRRENYILAASTDKRQDFINKLIRIKGMPYLIIGERIAPKFRTPFYRLSTISLNPEERHGICSYTDK